MEDQGTTTTDASQANQDPAPLSRTDSLIGGGNDADAAQQQDVALDGVFLPDDIKSNPGMTGINTVTDLAKRMLNAQSKIGAEKLVIPGKDATPEEWQEVYSKLGRPTSPGDYNFGPVEGLPDGAIPEERIKGFAEKAHELGLSSRQANNLLNWFGEQTVGDLETINANQEKAANEAAIELKREWGNAFGQKVRSANALFDNTKHGDEAVQILKDAGLANNATIVKWVAGLADNFGEDRLVGLQDQARGLSSGMTPDAARARIAEIQGNPEWQDIYSVGYRALEEERTRLFKDAYPEPVT